MKKEKKERKSVQINENNCMFITLGNGSPLSPYVFFGPLLG
jgi:hypothetical protein